MRIELFCYALIQTSSCDFTIKFTYALLETCYSMLYFKLVVKSKFLMVKKYTAFPKKVNESVFAKVVHLQICKLLHGCMHTHECSTHPYRANSHIVPVALSLASGLHMIGTCVSCATSRINTYDLEDGYPSPGLQPFALLLTKRKPHN